MSKYTQILKNVTDLLDKPFNFGHKVEVKTKTSNGATFTADATVSGKASANFKVEHKHGSLSVDKLTVGSDKKIVGEFTFAEAVKSTDLTFKFTDGTRADAKDIKASFGAVVNGGDAGTYTVDADVLDGPSFDFTGLVNYRNFLIGGSAKVNTTFLAEPKADAQAVALADVGVLAGYKAKDFTFAAQTKKNFDAADVTLYHAVSDKATAGALVTVPIHGNAFAFKFGGSYKLDADTTVHATADHDAKLSLVYKQKLNQTATISINSQIAAADLGSDKHKFGLTLQLSG